jgi:hypothetical protein
MSTELLSMEIELSIEPDAEAAELDETTTQLRQQLLELDVQNVERPRGEPAPPGTRAVDAAILGALVVQVGPVVLGAVVRTLEGWLARRPDRTLKMAIGDDSIELNNVSDEEQKRLITAFVARHTNPSP